MKTYTKGWQCFIKLSVWTQMDGWFYNYKCPGGLLCPSFHQGSEAVQRPFTCPTVGMGWPLNNGNSRQVSRSFSASSRNCRFPESYHELLIGFYKHWNNYRHWWSLKVIKVGVRQLTAIRRRGLVQWLACETYIIPGGSGFDSPMWHLDHISLPMLVIHFPIEVWYWCSLKSRITQIQCLLLKKIINNSTEHRETLHLFPWAKRARPK